MSDTTPEKLRQIISGEYKLTKDELDAKNAESEKMLNEIISPENAAGGGSASNSSVSDSSDHMPPPPPPPTPTEQLKERFDLLHFLIDTYKTYDIIIKFENDCEKIFNFNLKGKDENLIKKFVKIIDDDILSKSDYEIIFKTLFLIAQKKLTEQKLQDKLTQLNEFKTPSYTRFKVLQTIYRNGNLMKGGKPRRTRRQKQRKSRRQKQRKSRRRL